MVQVADSAWNGGKVGAYQNALTEAVEGALRGGYSVARKSAATRSCQVPKWKTAFRMWDS